MFYKSKDFCIGLKVEIDNLPYTIIENKFINPGKGQAFNKLKLKNILNKSIIQKTVKIGTKLKAADILFIEVIYLYADNDLYHFMNSKTKEYYEVSIDIISSEKIWLKNESMYSLLLWNQQIIAIKPPRHIELRVLSIDNMDKSLTMSKNLKYAILETGLSIKVPLFIKENDIIKIDTEKELYISRLKE